MATPKENEFDKLKQIYLQNTQKRKEVVLAEMRENLLDRGAERAHLCLDDKTHQVDSNNVEDLFAIDGALRFEKNKK